MKRQRFSRLFLLAIAISCVVFSGAVTWAATVKIISQAGEMKIHPKRNIGTGGFIYLYPGDKVTVKSGLAVIEYARLKRDCGAIALGEKYYGAVILGQGKTHTVQTALDATCTATDQQGISQAFSQARKGREQKVTLYAEGKAATAFDNTGIFDEVLRNNGLRRGKINIPLPRYGVVCIKNNTRWDIKYKFKWGNSSWKSRTIKTGERLGHTWEYDPGFALSPQFTIRFDADFSSSTDYKIYDLKRYQARNKSCDEGKLYEFEHRGKNRVDLYESGD